MAKGDLTEIGVRWDQFVVAVHRGDDIKAHLKKNRNKITPSLILRRTTIASPIRAVVSPPPHPTFLKDIN